MLHLRHHTTQQLSPRFGPARAYGVARAGVRARAAPGGCTIVSSSASEQALPRSTVDSAKATEAETAAAWWP